MNATKSLQATAERRLCNLEIVTEENQELQTRLDQIHEEVTHLVSYLQSPKFHEDPTVQVQDVLNRMAEIRSLSIPRQEELR